MNRRNKILVSVAIFLWFFVVLAGGLLVFFPYQKAFRIVFQNIVGGSNMSVSFVDARLGVMKAEASRLLVGHEAFQGSPIVELEKVNLTCSLGSILRGVLDVSSNALAYGGKLNFEMKDIPVIANAVPKQLITFSGVELSKYPEGRFQWFKGITGNLSGSISKEVYPYAREQQKGKFAITIRNGEIKEINVKNFPKLIFPFKEISVGGRISGERVDITQISIDGGGIIIKGTGVIDGGESQRRIDLRLTYEAGTEQAFFKGNGTIGVAGSLWSPDIVVVATDVKPPAKKS